MLPVDFEGANFTFSKPTNMTDEQCSSLRVYKGKSQEGFPVIISAWKPSKEDLDALNAGRPLWLSITGQGMPPVSIYTADENGKTNE